MALTLTRFTDLRSEQDEEEAKRKKTSGSARLKAAMESENVPQPTKEPETKTEEPTKLSGSARLQAAMESEPTKTNTTTTETKTPQISNTYREVDKEKGRIRTRPADLSTPSWQDDPEEMEREVKGKTSALQMTGSALSVANAAYQAASARKQTADNLFDLYNQSMAKYQAVLEDEKATAQEKLAAKRQLSALAPYQRQALTNAQRAGEDYAKAETAYNAGRTQYERQQAGLKQDQEALTRRWGLGDSKAAEYEKQADKLRKEADNLYRSGQATSSTLRLAESAEANALKERENYAKYLYATQGEEAANRYAAGEREKEEAASFREKVLNTIAGLGANFFSGIGGASTIMMSRLMELPEDALYAITGNEAFNLDREPYLRNSKALEASDPFRETANELKDRAGKLGGMIIDTGYAAGSMMGVGGLTGQVTGALANTGLMTKLTSIAESSPLLTSPAARRGAQMAVNVLRNPGNLGISLSSGVNSYSEALANGASFSQALANGLWKGLTEYVSNRMFSGTPLEDLQGEKGYFTKAVEFVADKLGKSDTLRALNQKTGGKVLNWLFDKAGEGLEEVITGVFDPIIDRITYDTEAEWLPKLDALTDEFIGGVLLSLMMTGGEAAMTGAVNLSTDRKIADYLVENWGIEQAEARKYAPQIRKALKATQDATEAVQQAETPAQQTTLARIVQKVTQGETLSGQDARKILADPEAMQALMDGGYLGGTVRNDSDGRKEIVRAAEEYAEENAAETAPQPKAESAPPVPGQVENAPETVRATENNAQIGVENAQNPEKPLSGIERLNAARAALEGQQEENAQKKSGGLSLAGKEAQERPASRGLILGNDRTEGTNNGTAAAENTADVSDRNGRRGPGERTRRETAKLARETSEWRALPQQDKAAGRQAHADDLQLEAVDARSLGVTSAAAGSTVRVYPRSEWEPDLQRIAERVEKATGQNVTFVLGQIRVDNNGKPMSVRGVNTGRGIIVQADALGVSAEKIATHEAYHSFARADKGLNERVLAQIRQQYPENRLRQIAETYLARMNGIVDLESTDQAALTRALKQVQEEICADAYAGINAFAANVDEYTQATRQAVTESRNRQIAEATERRTGPPERYSASDEDIRYSAADDEEYIPESAAEYDQLKRQGKVKAPKVKTPVAKSRVTIAKADLKKNLLGLYSIPAGSRAELGTMIDALADRYIREGRIDENDRRELMDKLYESGVVFMEADDGFQAVRDMVRNGRIYVSENAKKEWKDTDYQDFRREAFAEGIYLVNDESARGWDSWNAELAEAFPGIFDENEYDPREALERIVQVAREGRGEKLSLAEYAAQMAGMEFATEEDMMDNLERQADYALRTFAEKANLEIYLKDRTGRMIAQERQRMGELRDQAVQKERERGDKRVEAAKERGQEILSQERAREIKRRQKEREHRKEVAQRLRERQAMRELQQKTLKQLQWLNRNRNKFSGDMQTEVNKILEDIDIYAASIAEEMHIDKKTGKTWKELRDIYKEAKQNDPNFLPSAELERIVARLDNKKIGDLDIGALNDLYKAAVGLRTELYNRNNVIEDELHSTFAEVYETVKEEMQETPGSYESGVKGGIDAFLNDAQLTPMNRFQRMAGWNPNSRWYGMAKMLEKGEREQRRFKTEANRQIAPVLEQYADWARRADGKGKDAIWYEIKVPASWEYHMGDKPVFSKETVTVYMTPAQKVHMYLESKNLDNLRHMEGGRTFANKELYSKGERAEAFAQGTTVKLLPETVKSIVSDLTEEEQALANALEAFYNDYSKKEINRVSNILYGYDKAMGGYYAPIYTNNNYTKSEPGIFDLTAEGVGNLKSRVVSANPSLNLSAFDAFEKSVDKTGRFVGLSIPIRNLNTLMNWREHGNSTKEILDHKWGEKTTKWVEDLMTELQSGKDRSNSSIETLTNKALSRYITAVFGANPSIVAKQFASHPLAATYLDWKNLITGLVHVGQADPELIGKYTGELDYRMLGYAMPETAQIKNNPGILQRKGPINFLFGGGAITWMDGFTVRTLWSAAEQKVSREQPDLEIGTQEQINAGQSPYYQAVAKEFEEAVSRSQPMYDTMHRSNIMRETNPITRAFTLFKTVPQQEYNMLRQAVGEAEYYKRTGADKEIQAEARKRAGRAFAGVLIGNLMIGVVSFLNALWKNKGKYFRDEEGELTPESVAKGLAKQYFKDTAGLAIGGDIAADVLSSVLFGDKWYGLEMPGLEQLGSILEQSVNAGETVKKTVADSIDILQNGGDWGQYMADHSETYLNAVDQIVSTLGTYATGLPMDNVKAYLLGGVQWISPQIKTAYDDLMKQADKSGLKGLTGASLEMRTMHILQDRAGSADQRTAETVAGLYEAGYTDAVPATIQSSYTVNGEDRKMSAADDQLYRQVWRDSVSGTLDEITNDKAFKSMSPADQAKVLKKLYDYGAQNAKEAVWPDYSPDKWVTTAKGLKTKDVPLSEWLPIQQDLSKISGKNKKQEIRDYIDSLPYSRDQKKAMYTAEGYQDADDVNWHSGSYGGSSGKGKTYAPADTSKLQLPPSVRMNEQDRELWDMESHGGNVNLRTRKTIPVTRDNIETVKGWGMDSKVGDYMTVASQTYRDGDRAVVVTPILPDGSLMTQTELDTYMDSLRGSNSYADADDRGIILGVFDEGNWQQNLKESDAFAERIHELHEEREEQRKSSGLRLPAMPQAQRQTGGLRLQAAPKAKTASSGLRLR